MRGFFNCGDPLDTVCRVMDTARRMGMGFTQLEFAQEGDTAFSLSFTLDENDAQKVNTFTQRIGLYIDLTKEAADV
ncbi:hypothetical protein SAMN05444398_12615 [Roseovarius pacificus]|uniref:ACT domain-containing protein n=1 Tax=Roseovarius pacificus TaxID=337701 RepID=A0A1M7KB80_9RHOB|nr:hypothetical protein [Roseovarius pacificus]GGO62685.1 hypothetical protein GCM10011315_42230 [Roseovarius pacificus]SHM62494.1 hypothetical protein SAMN05444398_12615 [Roseovarius pacificus]